jgi:hypothetical protein
MVRYFGKTRLSRENALIYGFTPDEVDALAGRCRLFPFAPPNDPPPPLHVAVIFGHENQDIIDRLLEYGASRRGIELIEMEGVRPGRR